MIVRLSGKLEYIGTDCVHVSVGELVHELLIPAADIPELQPKVGQQVTFFTLEYLEGNASFGQLAPKMLGFLRQDDKDFFNLFITVKGIGPRKALRALAKPVGEIATYIATKDAKRLTLLPEIGKRTAETIIAELFGKVDTFATGARGDGAGITGRGAAGTLGGGGSGLPDFQQQAIEVLVKLGERRPDAENWVQRVCQVDPSLADAQKVIQGVYRLRQGVR
ncbi:MAG: Holliday junction branch migration protein RuvA [Phycisphaerae bacterium]